ncbi:RHS repeat-associated core domain-containing protein [Pseudomonas sp. HMWF021]|uniref:RHS repeat-associated core domain-containing protein n=1 Tax=Pseudomonas sp. HMWF021 TaxID=2056857 RepID=UPI000D335844|nr:RHS repeat-associated core domain-containing protein [Pseudomonas sp. HMWF021]PTT32532.1 toxin [Pseudomonas sp. HMWF021]
MNVHRRTPVIEASEGRGLPVRQIGYWRTFADAPAAALVSRQQHDAAGRLVAQWDPRLPRPCLTSVYTLTGAPLQTDSVDAGWRLSLPGLAGESLRRWDGRGTVWRTTHDSQLRVVQVSNATNPADDETFVYGDAAHDAGHNLRGQLLECRDASGSLHLQGYGLGGQPLAETRTFNDDQAFASRRRYNPLGVLLEQTDAGQHRQLLGYDCAGQLNHSQLQLAGQPAQAVLLDAQYNAAGQIIEQRTANQVNTRWWYDAANGRLHRQTARVGQQPPLQDFEYRYDPMGNVTRIDDHAFTPSHFANQRVDGHREFSYDSLYHLHSASGHDDAPAADNPGRPQPSDPADRRNYLQTYTYDAGGNLIRLVHAREGASHTREMFIDPLSNRGVRWREGDPSPEFDRLFDRHGNLQALQPGQALDWNTRDQLAAVNLVRHDDGSTDAERYVYSQGQRVYKRHTTYAANAEHFHEVRYLPGLEIRRRDNGEELHLITLAAGAGSTRCLHWVAGQPSGIDADQLRYHLEDHLGSCAMELDQQARMISHEGYYPFGATAWLAAGSAIEVAYRFVRYSGQEMDVSGLYDYGARYYAPWLQRWISPDPAGTADGPNLYAFVGNNPLRFVDAGGTSKAQSEILQYSAFISAVGGHSNRLLFTMHNIIHKKNIGRNLLANFAVEVVKGVVGYEAGLKGAGLVDLVAPAIPPVIPYLTIGGVVGGNVAGDLAGAVIDPLTNALAEHTGITLGPLIPQTSTMSVERIDSDLGIYQPEESISINSWSDVREGVDSALNSVLNPDFIMNRAMGSWISIIPASINLFARAIEAADIDDGLTPMKIGKIEALLDDWTSAIEIRSAAAESGFDTLGSDVLKNGFHTVTRQALQDQTRNILVDIAHAQRGLKAYREMLTSDGRFLGEKAHPTPPSNISKTAFYKWWTHAN